MFKTEALSDFSPPHDPKPAHVSRGDSCLKRAELVHLGLFTLLCASVSEKTSSRQLVNKSRARSTCSVGGFLLKPVAWQRLASARQAASSGLRPAPRLTDRDLRSRLSPEATTSSQVAAPNVW